jgi:hypothetical protein
MTRVFLESPVFDRDPQNSPAAAEFLKITTEDRRAASRIAPDMGMNVMLL